MSVPRLDPAALAALARDEAFRNSLGEGVYVLDADGRLLHLNDACETILGWKEDELRGRDMHDAIHYLHADGTPHPGEACPLLAVLRSGVDFGETDDVFVHRDGSLVPVAYVSSPVIVGDDVVGAVLAFWRR
jgi:PAS domain S-box-containing protein